MKVYRLEIILEVLGKFFTVAFALQKNQFQTTITPKTSLTLIGKMDFVKMFYDALSFRGLISDFPNYLGNDIAFTFSWKGISFVVSINSYAEITIISTEISDTQMKEVYNEALRSLSL